MNKGIIIILCDLNGIIGNPWRKAGFEVIEIDPQRENNGTILGMMPAISKAILSNRVVFVCGFPPCTDVAVSGAKHFESKRLKDPHFQTRAALVAEQCRMIGEICQVPWFFENPVSVFASIFDDCKLTYFNPYEFGGYLPEDDTNPQFPDIYPAQDGYPKKTGLFYGGGFVLPEKKPVPFVKEYPGFKKLGGKSLRTKNIRSATPRGFAQAIFNTYSNNK
jgi:hypothetical protein